MKRVYVKPEIAFENFSLSTHIAGDCEAPYVTTATKGVCGIPDDNGTETYIFSGNITGCSIPWDSDEYNGFCYHNPSENSNYFNS